MFIATTLYFLSRQRMVWLMDSVLILGEDMRVILMTVYHSFISMVKEGFCQFIHPLIYRFKEARQLTKFWWWVHWLIRTSLMHQQPSSHHHHYHYIQQATLDRTIYLGRSPKILQITGFRSLTCSGFREYGKPVSSSSWAQGFTTFPRHRS